MADSRFCAIRTKIERKIASRETTMVSRPNGKGSNGRTPNAPVFHAIHNPNHTT